MLTIAHPLELSSLLEGDGSAGFAINGINQNDRLGFSMSSGRFNDDAFDDLIIGGLGQTYVVFGRDGEVNPFPAVSQLNQPGGPQGFVLNGRDADDTFGWSVAAANVDGDAYDDLVIGSPNPSGESSLPGRTYVLYGGPNLSTLADANGVIDTDDMDSDGSNGFVIQGSVPDYLGQRVSSAGYINQDDKEDVIIVTRNSLTYEAFVVFGGTNFAMLHQDISSLTNDGSNGFRIQGGLVESSSFLRVSAGNINGDPYSDVILGAGGSTEKTYVVFGQDGVFPANVDLTLLSHQSNPKGFVINGVSDNGGWSHNVASADINGDSTDDVVIGAQRADLNGKTDVGRTYVVFGRDYDTETPFPDEFDASSLLGGSGADGLVINGIDGGDRTGSYLSFAGDVNHDEVQDIILGAYGGSQNGYRAGEAYVVFGGAANLNQLDAADGNSDGTVELSSLNGANGFAIYGNSPSEGSGPLPEWMASAGDVNGDEIDDLMLGFTWSDPNGTVDSGRTFVIYGSDAPTIEVFTKDYSNAPFQILDKGTIRSTLADLPLLDIANLKVQLNINHSRDSDLEVSLTSPANPSNPIVLFSGVGGNGDDFAGTILDDDVNRLITSGSAPFGGYYQPSGNLGSLETNIQPGDWTLQIKDNKKKQTGQLISWSLIVQPVSAGNRAPIANAGPDQTLSDGDDSGDETVTLDGSGSSDNDGSIVAYEWQEGAAVLGTTASISPLLSIGVHTITLTVTDDEGAADSDIVTVTVNPNQAPTANAGPNQTVTDSDGSGDETVTLNGSGSDPDGTVTAYEWKEGLVVLGNTASISPLLSVGVHTLILTVTDNAGDTSSDEVVVTINAPSVSTTKFYVVDSSADDTFEYDAAGNLEDNYNLGSGNNAPRGVAADATGSTVWVIDNDDYVYVYDADGIILRSWKATGLSRPEGIATDGDGEDVWIVDRGTDRAYFFDGGGSRTTNTGATSSFALASRNPRGITTDGVHLWVVDTGTDRVYKYTVAGLLLDSWSLDGANGNPRGITIDPSGASDNAWVVDSGTDKVFEYGNRDTGGLVGSFGLAAGNANPQGIADPPPKNSAVTPLEVAPPALVLDTYHAATVAPSNFRSRSTGPWKAQVTRGDGGLADDRLAPTDAGGVPSVDQRVFRAWERLEWGFTDREQEHDLVGESVLKLIDDGLVTLHSSWSTKQSS